jgi:glycosyltransferase involved in cell wall biosynthesis
MKRLGVVAIARPENGGTFQYTLSTLYALRRVRRWEMTLYTGLDNTHFDDLGFQVRRLRSSRLDSAISVLRDTLSFPGPDPFAREDAVFGPTYAPSLLLTRKPFGYTLHDLQERHFPQYFTRAQRWWRGLIHERLSRRAARMLCESRHVRDDIVRFLGVPAHKIDVSVAPPLLMPPSSGAAGDAVRKKHELPATFLFYPAQFWAHKNHLRLVDAFARVAPEFPDCELVLTGAQRGAYREVIERIARLGITGRVKHVGYVDQAELASFYDLATAVVIPSQFESVSIPIYEAFQAGAPVCASSIPALVEQVADAGLLFDALSVDSMAASLRTILRDRDLRSVLAVRGRQRLAALTHDRYAAELEGFVENLAA